MAWRLPVSFSIGLNPGHKIIEEKCDAFTVDVYYFTWQVNLMPKTCFSKRLFEFRPDCQLLCQDFRDLSQTF